MDCVSFTTELSEPDKLLASSPSLGNTDGRWNLGEIDKEALLQSLRSEEDSDSKQGRWLRAVELQFCLEMSPTPP